MCAGGNARYQMPLGAGCKKEGCKQPRARHSVFCDQHHAEQLDSASLLELKEPCEEMRDECRRVIHAGKLGAITGGEIPSRLFDIFVHSGTRGLEDCWMQCIEVLPPDAITDLLRYAEA